MNQLNKFTDAFKNYLLGFYGTLRKDIYSIGSAGVETVFTISPDMCVFTDVDGIQSYVNNIVEIDNAKYVILAKNYKLNLKKRARPFLEILVYEFSEEPARHIAWDMNDLLIQVNKVPNLLLTKATFNEQFKSIVFTVLIALIITVKNPSE